MHNGFDKDQLSRLVSIDRAVAGVVAWNKAGRNLQQLAGLIGMYSIARSVQIIVTL